MLLLFVAIVDNECVFVFAMSLSKIVCFLLALLIMGVIFGSAGFVGDSLNRNMFVSLFCTLRSVVSNGQVKKWRPAGADRGFTFLTYNLTIAYHRTNLLARYGR